MRLDANDFHIQVQIMSTVEQQSVALQSIFGTESSKQDFFKNVWQKECKIFRASNRPPSKASSCPLSTLIDTAWPTLISLLQHARARFESESEDTLAPILFSNGTPRSPALYNTNLFHAYLDGCSIVVNHADWSSAEIATLCLDLQKSFPHGYANAYLTPPASQAVSPHADDRDVLVIQLVGKKHWKVYSQVPIPVRKRSTFVMIRCCCSCNS
jgi:hypothetical protein